jgi:hypothetical protein
MMSVMSNDHVSDLNKKIPFPRTSSSSFEFCPLLGHQLLHSAVHQRPYLLAPFDRLVEGFLQVIDRQATIQLHENNFLAPVLQ